MVFDCHVTLQDHVIIALHDFMIRSLSRYINILASGHKHYSSRAIMLLVCHVILQEHLIKE